MVALLGLCAAVAYGAADFLGGAASRRATVFAALMVSMPVGLTALLCGALLVGGSPTAGLAWGIGSGVAGGTGLITFYRALARGPMSVVAPVSALASAVLPVAVGTVRGERLHTAALVGVLFCLAAIGLVSMDERGPERVAACDGPRWRRALDSGPVMAIVSGTGFGVFFVLLKEAGTGGGLWPLVASRAGGFTVLLIVIAVFRRRPSGFRNRGLAGLAVASGVLDAAANILYLLAVQRGLLSLAAVLASLYPAVTVLLARSVYSERLRAVQQVGMAVAVAGVALVTVG